MVTVVVVVVRTDVTCEVVGTTEIQTDVIVTVGENVVVGTKDVFVNTTVKVGETEVDVAVSVVVVEDVETITTVFVIEVVRVLV